jgi:hypothetical protein
LFKFAKSFNTFSDPLISFKYLFVLVRKLASDVLKNMFRKELGLNQHHDCSILFPNFYSFMCCWFADSGIIHKTSKFPVIIGNNWFYVQVVGAL